MAPKAQAKFSKFRFHQNFGSSTTWGNNKKVLDMNQEEDFHQNVTMPVPWSWSFSLQINGRGGTSHPISEFLIGRACMFVFLGVVWVKGKYSSVLVLMVPHSASRRLTKTQGSWKTTWEAYVIQNWVPVVSYMQYPNRTHRDKNLN